MVDEPSVGAHIHRQMVRVDSFHLRAALRPVSATMSLPSHGTTDSHRYSVYRTSDYAQAWASGYMSFEKRASMSSVHRHSWYRDQRGRRIGSGSRACASDQTMRLKNG